MRNSIKIALKQEIEKGHNKFIICPFGSLGHLVKQILNEDFGLSESLLVDDKFEIKNVFTVAALKNRNIEELDEYIILATDREDIYQEKIEELSEFIRPERVIYIFNRSNAEYRRNLLEKDNFDFKNCIYELKRENVKFYIPNWDIDVTQQYRIFLNNRFNEDEYLYYISRRFQNNLSGKTVIDIGANIGNHSLFFALKTDVKRVYAFEPVKESFEILEKNVKINNLMDKVIINNYALGDKEARVDKEEFNIRHLGATSVFESENGEMEEKTLDGMKMEDVIALIKIDVEGFEEKVIKGAMDTIKKYKPILMIECHEHAYTFWNIYNLLHPLDYKVEPYDYKNYIFYI